MLLFVWSTDKFRLQENHHQALNLALPNLTITPPNTKGLQGGVSLGTLLFFGFYSFRYFLLILFFLFVNECYHLS